MEHIGLTAPARELGESPAPCLASFAHSERLIRLPARPSPSWGQRVAIGHPQLQAGGSQQGVTLSGWWPPLGPQPIAELMNFDQPTPRSYPRTPCSLAAPVQENWDPKVTGLCIGDKWASG
jgi:hypothetical protein